MSRKKSHQKQNGVPGRPLRGYDGAGHIDPGHAQRLLEEARAGQEAGPDDAFLTEAGSDDALAEELGEAAVEAMTSGEEQLTTDLENTVEEERGGPFVETSGDTEFAGGVDESNIAEATREPFPTT